MAVSLKVLTNISNALKEKLTRNEIQSLRTREGREKHKKTLREIYDDVCRNVISEGSVLGGAMYSEVGYIKDHPMSFEYAEGAKGYGFGATKPDEIREAMLSWNMDQSRNLIRLFGEFEKIAEKEGVAKLSDLLTSCVNDNGFIEQDKFHYPASIYELRKALDAVDGVFSYGQNRIFYDTEGNISPYVTPEVIAQAKEHPEDFLIIEVYYD